MRLHVLETRLETDKPLGMEHPVDGSPSGWVWQHSNHSSLKSPDRNALSRISYEAARRGRPILRRPSAHDSAAPARLHGLRPIASPGDFRSDIQFMQRVAAQVAVAVDNALNFESTQAYQRELAEQRDRLQVLLDINNVLVTSRELSDLFRGIVSALTRVIHHDYTSLPCLMSRPTD